MIKWFSNLNLKTLTAVAVLVITSTLVSGCGSGTQGASLLAPSVSNLQSQCSTGAVTASSNFPYIPGFTVQNSGLGLQPTQLQGSWGLGASSYFNMLMQNLSPIYIVQNVLSSVTNAVWRFNSMTSYYCIGFFQGSPTAEVAAAELGTFTFDGTGLVLTPSFYSAEVAQRPIGPTDFPQNTVSYSPAPRVYRVSMVTLQNSDPTGLQPQTGAGVDFRGPLLPYDLGYNPSSSQANTDYIVQRISN